MRVVVVVPSSLGPPPPVASDTADVVLAARAAGADVRVCDLDGASFAACTAPDLVAHLVGEARRLLAAAEAAGRRDDAYRLAKAIRGVEAAAAEESARDPADRSAVAAVARFRARGTFAAFVHQLEPRCGPRLPGGPAASAAFARSGAWTPLADLTAARFVDEALRSGPDVLAFAPACDDGIVDAVRTARAAKARRPEILTALVGPLAASTSGDPEATADFDWTHPGADPGFWERLLARRGERAMGGSAPAWRGVDPSRVRGLRLAARVGDLPGRFAAAVAALRDDPCARYVVVEERPAAVEDLLRLAAAATGSELRFAAETSLDPALLRPDVAAALAAGGCRFLTLRLRSATPAVRAGLGETLPFEAAAEAARTLRAAGIGVGATFEIGFFGEGRAETLATARAAERLRGAVDFVAFGGVDPARGPLWTAATTDASRLPDVRADRLTREELDPLRIMLARYDLSAELADGVHLPFAAEGRPFAPFSAPFSVPEEFAAFCTPHPPGVATAAAPRTPSGDPVLFEDDFGFRREMEAAFEAILAEWRALPAEMLVEHRDDGYAQGSWAQYGLYGAGLRVPRLCARFPRLDAALRRVPNLYTAAFSIVGPRSRLTAHCGEDRSLLRAHLPLVIPPGSGFVVGGATIAWEPGKTLVFDDTLPHAAWNDHPTVAKVLVLIDFRPPHRLAQGFRGGASQAARDRARYLAMYPEWSAEAVPIVGGPP